MNILLNNKKIVSKYYYFYGNVGGADVVINLPSPSSSSSSSSSSSTTTVSKTYTPSRTPSGPDIVIQTPDGPALIDPVTKAVVTPDPVVTTNPIGTTTTVTTYTPSKPISSTPDIVIQTPDGPALIDPITKAIATSEPVITTVNPFSSTTPNPLSQINALNKSIDLSNSNGRIEYIYKGLLDRGWTDAGAKAVIANMANETVGFSPYVSGDNGQSHGLCQWRDNRWTNYLNFVDNGGYNFQDGGIGTAIDSQLDYLTYEVKNVPDYSGVWNKVNYGDNIDDSINYFCRIYEGAGSPGIRDSSDDDTAAAFQVIENYKSNSANSSSALSTGTPVTNPQVINEQKAIQQLYNAEQNGYTKDQIISLGNNIVNSSPSGFTNGTTGESLYNKLLQYESNQKLNQSTQLANPAILSLKSNNIGPIISNLNTCIGSLESSINEIKSNEIQKINDSWAAKEASIYISKVQAANEKINKVLEGLRLLSQTYSKALNESQTTQSEVSSVVENI